MMERLRCGVIYTGAFQTWLHAWKLRESAANFGLLPEIDYVRCSSGERAGQSWVTLFWRPLAGAKPHEVFAIGEVSVFIGKQARHGLRDRCLDIKDNSIVVL
jgi:hypothetical protein